MEIAEIVNSGVCHGERWKMFFFRISNVWSMDNSGDRW